MPAPYDLRVTFAAYTGLRADEIADNITMATLKLAT